MAPTTRAATKRLYEETAELNAPDASADGPNKKARTDKKSTAPNVVTDNRCRLLELPAELRNHIYDFAVEDLDPTGTDKDFDLNHSLLDFDRYFEDLDQKRYVPRARTVQNAVKPWSERLWTFFAFTQACKQIRAEYRPLWLHNLSVRLTVHTFPLFVRTFLPKVEDLQHAPKLIQISWHHQLDNYTQAGRDATPLLQLRAHSPSLRVEFVPFRIADLKQWPGDELCERCEELTGMDDRLGGYGFYDFDGMCDCEDEEMEYDDWVDLEQARMQYMEVVRDLVSNNNEIWLTDIRNKQMTVQCSFTGGTNHVKFRIVCKKAFGRSTSEIQAAWDLLKGWGIFDLSRKAEMEFVLAFEKERKMKVDGYELTSSIVREVCVPRLSR